MILATKLDDGIYLRLVHQYLEIHVTVYYDENDGVGAVAHVYRCDNLVRKCFGSKRDVFNKIREACQ